MLQRILLFLIVAVVFCAGIFTGRLWLTPKIKIVREEIALPPFYENVFRVTDIRDPNFILQDPIVSQRQKPFVADEYIMGPNDLLGFRNLRIPQQADVITIGDSQTYGNNVRYFDNWPNRLGSLLETTHLAEVYNMGSAGWGALQYRYMFDIATLFKPRVIVIALYTGNDFLDTFQTAYSHRYWESYRLNPKLTVEAYPSIAFPPPVHQQLSVDFDRRRVKTVFTPDYRLAFNRRTDATVLTGIEITKKVIDEIDTLAGQMGMGVVVTVIPTKEMVYAKRLASMKVELPRSFGELIDHESENIQHVRAHVEKKKHLRFISLLENMQREAEINQMLYLRNDNGHPVENGYRVIAESLVSAVKPYLLPKPQRGLYRVVIDEKNDAWALVTENQSFHFFSTQKVAQDNGWAVHKAPTIRQEHLFQWKRLPPISTVEPTLFGP